MLTKYNTSSHIAIFIPSLHGGGAERVIVALANGLAARGHRVDLVLTRAEGPYLTEVAHNVRIVNLDKNRVLASFLPLVRYLRSERPDALLSALNHANFIAILARMFAGACIRLVVSERNSLEVHPAGLRGQVGRILMRRLYPAADGVIAVSQAMAKELTSLLDLPPAKVVAIPNPVDFSALQGLSRIRPDHPWLVSNQPPVVLAVGRLEPQKDYPVLLEAFARLNSERDVRLVILGEGSQRKELEGRISRLGIDHAVDLAGFENNPFGWMAACDLFVLASRNEGFPNSLVQAMACGAKVVCTDCPTGPDEILEGGRWGRLVAVGDAVSLTEAMAQMLDNSAPPDVRSRARQFESEKAIVAYERIILAPMLERKNS